MPLKNRRLVFGVALISISAAVGWALGSVPQPAPALTAAARPALDSHAAMDMAMPDNFFNPGPFMPHGGCYLWTQSLILLHTLSDGAIGLAYFTIPIILLYFVRRRQDLKFKWIFVLFAAFVMACGTTHLMEIWNIWHADYWLAGFVKAFTALVSVGTTLLLVKLLPVALALPSADALRKAHGELEIRVQERTTELEQTNRALQSEITERKRAEAALRIEKDRIRAILDIVGNPIFVKDNDHRITFANRAFYDLFCADENSVLGKTLAEAVPENERRHFLEVDRRVLDTGQSDLREEELTVKDFTRTIVTRKIRFMDESGNRCLVGSIHDITDRKLAEQALRASEAELRAMAESMPQMVWACTPDGLNIYFNQQWVDYTGLTLEESHGPGWIKPFHPDDQPRAWAAWENAVQNNGDYRVECRLRRADGTYHWWLIRGVPQRDETGKILKWFGTCTDIEALKQTVEKERAARHEAERFRTAMDQVHACVYMKDVESRYLYANQPTQKLFGLSAAALVGSGDTQFFPRDTVKRLREIDARVFRGEQTSEEVEVRDEQGQRRVYWEVKTPIYADAERQQVSGLLGISTDITERKQMEEALEHSRHLLAQSEEMGKVGGWEFDIATRQQTWTESVYHIHELEPTHQPTVEEGINFYTPACRPIIERAVSRAIELGETFDVELEIITAKGNRRSVHAIGHADLARGKVFGFFQDITERKLAEEKIASLALRHETLLQTGSDGVHVLDEQGNVVEANQAFGTMLGYTHAEALQLNVADWDAQWTRAELVAIINEMMTHPTVFETRQRRKDGSVITVEISVNGVVLDGRNFLYCAARDITARKQAETYGLMGREILRVLNEPGDLKACIERVVATMKSRTGLDAVGIRLPVGDDFPYFVQSGFTEEFLQTENTLVQRKPDGGVCRDKDGIICLECTCGLVLAGKTNPANSLFTPGGSCWTNDSKTILHIPPNLDPRRHPRNRCIHDGYNSVMLVPIRAHDQILGLIQFNDRRKDCFTLKMVELMEEFAQQIGLALQRKSAEAALAESETRFRAMFEQAAVGMAQVGLDGAWLRVNQRICDIVGYSREELLAKKFQDITHPDDLATDLGLVRQMLAGEIQTYSLEKRYYRKDQSIVSVNLTVALVREPSGAPKHFISVVEDITVRKQAQAQVRAFAHLNERLSRLTDARDAAGAVINTALELLGWDACFLVLYDTATDTIRELIRRDTFTGQGESEPVAVRLPNPTPMMRRVIEHGGQLILRQDASEADSSHRFGDTSRVSLSLLYVPLRHHDQVIGFLSVQSYQRNAYTQQSLATLQSLADQCAGAIARIEAEAARRESEERYHHLFELESDAIVLVDCETHRYVDFNQSAQQLYGYSREELLQMTPEDISTDPEKTRVIIGSGSFTVPLRWHRKKNGELFAAELTGNQIIYQGRRTDLTTIRDVTARQQVLVKLQDATRQLLEAQRIASLGSYIFKIPTGSWTSSEVLDEIFGFAEPGVTRDLGAWVNLIHPQDRAEMERYLAEKVLTGQTAFDRTYRIIRANDQSERWVHGLGKVTFDESGQAEQMVGVIQDITERKRVEESHARLALAVDQAAETIIITDTKGTILYVNPAFEQTSGYTRAEVLGQNPRFLKSDKQDAEFYGRMWAVLEQGEIWRGHFINRRKDGTLYEEEATISPIRDPGGTIVNFVAVKRDVTREVQLENQFRQTQKMEAIGTLAGGIAHDFNNILAAMFGYGYLLQQDTEGNPAAQESIGEILKATSRAKDLVSQILTFSRQREQKRQVIPLDTIVKEAIKFLRASLPAEIKIEMAIAPDAPHVLADPTQIYQVTINLATNALHAMEGKPGTLAVKLNSFIPDNQFIGAHPEFQPVQYARLTVADTGHGMDAATLTRIFEPFFTTKPIGKGTGLGLAVVHGIVKSHDGIITVDSELGKGTTFHLDFPAQANPLTMTNAAVSPLATGRGEKILLVDDEPAVTESMQRFLAQLNYQVTSCNSARAAVALFREDPARFDLVITDLTMPEINGIEVARQMRMLRANLPILLFSGYAPGLDPENLRAAGILKRLVKPVVMTDLARIIHQSLTPPPAN